MRTLLSTLTLASLLLLAGCADTDYANTQAYVKSVYAGYAVAVGTSSGDITVIQVFTSPTDAQAAAEEINKATRWKP